MARVLNGEVQVGDRVAYATRDGNCAAIHLGTVVGIREKPHSWREGVKVTTLKVQVEIETDPAWHSRTIPRTIGQLDRVVIVDRPGRRPAETLQEVNRLLGRQVKVTLNRPEGVPAEVSEGKFLGFGEDGEFEVLAEDGIVWHGWPMLTVELSGDEAANG